MCPREIWNLTIFWRDHMQIFFGALSIRGLDSSLVPGNRWLLRSGFPDVMHAARAATDFIVNVRHLDNGAHVTVTGEARAVGEQPAIEMTDINAAGSLAPHFIASDEFQAELANADPDIKSLFQKPATRRTIGKKAASKGKSKAEKKAGTRHSK